MIEALLILRKYWFVGVIVALAFALIAMRATIAEKNTTLATRNAQVVDLTKANKDAATVINRLAAARLDNDAIANGIASKVKVNETHETQVRTIIERAGDANPAVHNWLVEPVPSSVRAALSSGGPVASAH